MRRTFARTRFEAGLFAVMVLASMPAYGSPTPILPSVGDPSLTGAGGILDTLYGLGNLNRVSDDLDQVWFNVSGHASVVGIFAAAPQIIGFVGLSGEFQPLFQGAGSGYAVSGSGSLPAGSVLPTFRWANQAGSGQPVVTSRNSDNPAEQDFMVTWLITGGPSAGHYVIGWEDSISIDKDFQDAVVEVYGVAPGDEVPGPMPSPVVAPSALVLFGPAIGAIGVLARHRDRRPRAEGARGLLCSA